MRTGRLFTNHFPPRRIDPPPEPDPEPAWTPETRELLERLIRSACEHFAAKHRLPAAMVMDQAELTLGTMARE